MLTHVYKGLAMAGNFALARLARPVRGSDSPANMAPVQLQEVTNPVNGAGMISGNYVLVSPFVFNASQPTVPIPVNGSGIDALGTALSNLVIPKAKSS